MAGPTSFSTYMYFPPSCFLSTETKCVLLTAASVTCHSKSEPLPTRPPRLCGKGQTHCGMIWKFRSSKRESVGLKFRLAEPSGNAETVTPEFLTTQQQTKAWWQCFTSATLHKVWPECVFVCVCVCARECVRVCAWGRGGYHTCSTEK